MKFALDVWLRFIEDDDEEADAEANTYLIDDRTFLVEWYLTAVGLVSSRTFDTYQEAADWLTSEGFTDYTS